LLVVAALVFPRPFLTVDSGPVNAEMIILLGGGSHERYERAVKLFKDRAAPRILAERVLGARGEPLPFGRVVADRVRQAGVETAQGPGKPALRPDRSRRENRCGQRGDAAEDRPGPDDVLVPRGHTAIAFRADLRPFKKGRKVRLRRPKK